MGKRKKDNEILVKERDMAIKKETEREEEQYQYEVN